jgi:hypothetical protein
MTSSHPACSKPSRYSRIVAPSVAVLATIWSAPDQPERLSIVAVCLASSAVLRNQDVGDQADLRSRPPCP